MLTDAFEYITKSYLHAKAGRFAGSPVAKYIRDEAPVAVRNALKPDGLLVKGSAGKGVWANTPWISILNPQITQRASEGFYIVYLFAADMSCIYLSFNQAVSPYIEKSAQAAKGELRHQAREIAARLQRFHEPLDQSPIDLASKGKLGRLYEAGHVCGRRYDARDLPPESQLQADLNSMVHVYLDYAELILHQEAEYGQKEVSPTPPFAAEDQEEYGRTPSDPNHPVNRARRQWLQNRDRIIEFIKDATHELDFILRQTGQVGDNGGPPLEDNPLSQIVPQLREMKENLGALIKELEAPFPLHQKARIRINNALDRFENNLTPNETAILKATGKVLLPEVVKWAVSMVREQLQP